MTDGAMLTEILTQLEIPCDKYSFHGKLDALAAGLGIDTEGGGGCWAMCWTI